MFICSSGISQHDAKAASNRIKSIYLYQVAKNVYWASSYTKGDFTIGIYGNRDFYNVLNATLKNKMNGSQKIIFDFYESTSEISDCHLLFVGPEKSSLVGKVRKVLNDKTFLVTEGKDLASTGSMLNFVHVQSKLRYQVNKTKAEKGNFTIGESLIKSALKPIL